jgi:nucleoside-diphosphate-sugar epimerase
MKTVLLTGSEGLIGHRLRDLLAAAGYRVLGLDLRDATLTDGAKGNILDADLVGRLAAEADGVVHLAAVSRVIDGQKNPELCRLTNITGSERVINAARVSAKKPWLVYASSREVYGEPTVWPVTEDHKLDPINIYGHTKVAAEEMVNAFAAQGGVAGIVRLANVHGSTTHDHPTRVIPAFTRAAALGETLHVEGSDNTFDFTSLHDTCDGILRVVQKLDGTGQGLPPIHFLTGRPTTLGELAQLAVSFGRPGARIVESPPRSYDVSKFYGSYARAKQLLGWEPTRKLEDTLAQMVRDWQANPAIPDLAQPFTAAA